MSSPKYPIRSISTAPTTAVTKEGRYNLGCFDSPIADVNLLDINSSLFQLFPTPTWLKYIQLREWQAYQLFNNDGLFILIAVYQAKKVPLVQFIVYDTKTKDKLKYERKVFLTTLHVPNTLYQQSKAYYHSANFNIDIVHALETNQLDIRVKIEDFINEEGKKLPNIEGNWRGYHNTTRYQPMVVVNPFDAQSAMYSHKCLMPMTSGVLHIGNDRTVLFNPMTSQIIIDDHKGYYPYETKYDWVTGLAMVDRPSSVAKRPLDESDTSHPDKIHIGFNLTRNQVIQSDQYNENCLWYDGELHPLPPVTFKRPNGYQDQWFVEDEHDMVKLTFTPVTHTSVNLNLLIIQSCYQGPYGFFEGYLRKKDGEKVMIDRVFGMGEDFYLRM